MRFVECDTCRGKSGSPVLCEGCLANRTTIENLWSSLQRTSNTVESYVIVTDGLKEERRILQNKLKEIENG